MNELTGFSKRRHLRPVPDKTVSPAPVKEWPLVMSFDGVLAVCPTCGERIRVKNIGQSWAAASTHNEERHPERNDV